MRQLPACRCSEQWSRWHWQVNAPELEEMLYHKSDKADVETWNNRWRNLAGVTGKLEEAQRWLEQQVMTSACRGSM